MTWKILTDDTHKILYWSGIRPVDPSDLNKRATLLSGEENSTISDPVIKSRARSGETIDPDQLLADAEQKNSQPSSEQPPIIETVAEEPPPSPIFEPSDLVGRSFLMPPQEDGQKFRARVVKLLEDHESSLEENPTRIKFLCSVNDDKAEEIITYNQLLDHITRDEETDIVWKF